MLWLLFVVSFITQVVSQYPENEYEYSVRREWLKDEESSLSGPLPVLSTDEHIVDHYLQYLKWVEFRATEDIGFRPARPVQEEMDKIMNSEVFKILRPLPKGGIMHSHENHEVSKETLLRLIYDSDQFEHLYIVKNTSTKAPWTLDFFHNHPLDDEWVKVSESGYSFDEILNNQIFFGMLTDYANAYPTDSGERWRRMNPLWGRGSTQLVANSHIKGPYLEALYIQSQGEGVQYLETRKNFGAAEMLYEIDTSGSSSATYGKKMLDNREGAYEFEITQQVLEEYKMKNPRFIGHRRIIYSTRYMNTFENIKADMERAINLRQQFPDYVIGYDLVAEEDQGNSLLYYLPNFLQLNNNSKSRIPLYLHTAETNWPDDLITAGDDNDPVSTLENIYDAILLGAKRVGHGLGFFKHPYILNELKKRGIAVEVCPVSNQLLGFFPDLRVHPALNYYRSGVPIVLGPDDPGTFGYNYFSIDWYEIYMAWGLTLADLKKLAMNSLQYSGMSEAQRQDAIDNYWQPSWNEYINEIKNRACDANLTNNEPSFSRIIPSIGAHTGPTDVHIYGRNFERAICKTVTCTFGDLPSGQVTYVTNSHIKCVAPDVSTMQAHVADAFDEVMSSDTFLIKDGEITVEVKVNLGDGTDRIIGNFTYMYDTYTTTTIATVSASNGMQGSPLCMILVICCSTFMKNMYH